VKTRPAFLNQLRKAIVDALKANGIQAQVRSEPVPTTKLYRVAVLSPQFKAMRHSERQSLVWRITERAISPADQMRISMILTLTTEEAKGR
jgi:hypothetical protein